MHKDTEYFVSFPTKTRAIIIDLPIGFPINNIISPKLVRLHLRF